MRCGWGGGARAGGQMRKGHVSERGIEQQTSAVLPRGECRCSLRRHNHLCLTSAFWMRSRRMSSSEEVPAGCCCCCCFFCFGCLLEGCCCCCSCCSAGGLQHRWWQSVGERHAETCNPSKFMSGKALQAAGCRHSTHPAASAAELASARSLPPPTGWGRRRGRTAAIALKTRVLHSMELLQDASC